MFDMDLQCLGLLRGGLLFVLRLFLSFCGNLRSPENNSGMPEISPHLKKVAGDVKYSFFLRLFIESIYPILHPRM